MASKIVTEKHNAKTKEVKKNAKPAVKTDANQTHLVKANKAMTKAWAHISQRSNKRD
jgi:hypothetical protein